MTDPKPLAVLALLALGLAACAGEKPAHHADVRHYGPSGGPGAPALSTDVFLFLPYDSDHDHRVTRAERDAAIAGVWREIAQDRDSVRLLDLQDWFAKIDGAAATPFNALEFATEGGGIVTRAQFTEALIRRFNALDRNENGVLEPSEFLVSPSAQPRGESGAGPGPDGGGRHRRRGGGGGPY